MVVRGSTRLLPGDADLLRVVGDYGLPVAEYIEQMHESMRTDHLPTELAELDDLCGREDLGKLSNQLIVDSLMVGRHQVYQAERQLLTLVEIAAQPGRDQTLDISLVDRVDLARRHAWLAPVDLPASNPDELQ